MADDAARSRLGRGLAALIGDVGDESQVAERARAASARCRSNSSAPIRAIRASCSPTPSSTSSRTRSASAASSSRSWCARAAPTTSRSSPASGAGARRSAPACTRCRSSCSTSATARRSSLRSSRTCSAADLNPLEEATGYQALADEFNHTQDDIAKIVGKSRSHIANTLRLLKLPETVKAYINSGKLTAGHARMLVGQPNAEELARRDRQPRAQRAPGRGAWRARAARQQARAAKRARAARARMPTPWRWRSGCPTRSVSSVTIDHRGNGGGMLQVRYRTLEQLDDVIRRLESGPKIEADDESKSGPRVRRT